MTNSIAVAIIAFLLAVNGVTIIKLLFVDMKKNPDKLLMYMSATCFALMGWQLTYMIYFLSSDTDVMRLTYDLKLAFIAFTSFFMMILVIRFYRMDHSVNSIFVINMLVIPCFTLIYSLMTENVDLIRESFSVLELTPVHIVDAPRGVWFWVHTFSCYSFIVGGVVISLYSHNKLPGTYRKPSYALLSGVCLVAFANILQLTGINHLDFDVSVIGAGAAVIITYFAVVSSKGVDFITGARDEIYDYLPEGIMILNDERYVVYINKGAEEKLNRLGLRVINESYDSVFERAVGDASNIEAPPADENGLDMTFMSGSNEIIYNLSEKPIKDNSGTPIGTFVVIDEVTKNRTVISKLENIGGIDALTGLPNRRSIEKFMINTDELERFPIAVISGDINGLKTVNDSMGHKQGDVLIRLVAEIMANSCPTRGRVSRIGGDEFLMIIPNSKEEEIKDIIALMEDTMRNNRDYPFRASVSFGFDFKLNGSQNLSEVVSTADERMYEQKKMRSRL